MCDGRGARSLPVLFGRVPVFSGKQINRLIADFRLYNERAVEGFHELPHGGKLRVAFRLHQRHIDSYGAKARR